MSFAKTFWLKSKGVERLLGIDRSKVRRMKAAGDLPFVCDERGVAHFPRKEVEEMAQAKGRIIGVAPGPVVAKAFALFAQGKTWQEVVIALGQDPRHAQPVEVVRTLHAQFLDQDKRPPPVARPKRAAASEGVVDAEVYAGQDVDQWQQEQADAALHAQAQHDREQRAWEEEQRKRNEAITRSVVTHPASSAREPSPTGERHFADLMALLPDFARTRRSS